LNGNWRKSTYSGGQGGNCVEVASAPGLVAIRDTKDKGHGPVLHVSPAAFRKLVISVR
jgi:hypothetical protein